MLTSQAKEIAREWVSKESINKPGIVGAILTGSINWMDDRSTFPDMSDVDITIFVEKNVERPMTLMFPYEDIQLDVSYDEIEAITNPEKVLQNYYLAPHFSRPSILYDPGGFLHELQGRVAKEYGRREWVLKRCEHARDFTLLSMQYFNEQGNFYDQALWGIFPQIILGHTFTAAALENPTFAKILMATAKILTDYDEVNVQEDLLALLGSVHLTKNQVDDFLRSLHEAFQDGVQYINTPYFKSEYISERSRDKSVGVCQRMVDAGYYREAVLWIYSIHLFCMQGLILDAPEEIWKRHDASFHCLADAIDLGSIAGIKRHHQAIREYTPTAMVAAERIISKQRR